MEQGEKISHLGRESFREFSVEAPPEVLSAVSFRMWQTEKR